MTARIHTDRLALVPMTPRFLRASLDGDLEAAGREIGLSVPPAWPDVPEILLLRLWQLEADPDLQPWLLRAIGLRSTGEMVGHIGFHEAPGAKYLDAWCPGGLEFGFTVFPAHRRKGYAREASLALMTWARQNSIVAGFVLSIAPGNLPSRSLAQSLGFRRVGTHLDEVDGPEDVFVRNGAVHEQPVLPRS
jgi:[ribosomal protein S5]-alanine N-acetyltransferase